MLEFHDEASRFFDMSFDPKVKKMWLQKQEGIQLISMSSFWKIGVSIEDESIFIFELSLALKTSNLIINLIS